MSTIPASLQLLCSNFPELRQLLHANVQTTATQSGEAAGEAVAAADAASQYLIEFLFYALALDIHYGGVLDELDAQIASPHAKLLVAFNTPLETIC